MKLLLRFLFLLMLLALLQGKSNLYGQETGKPFIQNYSYKDYNANAQNWSVVQDRRGFIYIGNNDGVLEYDGVSWRLIPIKNSLEVRSLAVDSSGIIYVGAIGDFGYLKPDSLGKIAYFSLSDSLREEESQFEDVWVSFGLHNGVIFYTDQKIFRYESGEFTIWPADFGNFFLSFKVGDKFLVHQENLGLTLLNENDNFEQVKGGENFIGERVFVVLPYDREQLLVGVEKAGLYLLDTVQGQVKMLDEITNQVLQDQLIYQGTRLADGNFVIGTQQGGIFLIDPKGNIIQSISKSTGLPDNSINGMWLDVDQGLWLATSNGVSRVEIASDLSSWSEADGLSGSVLDILRFEGSLFVATFSGVYRIDKNIPVKIQGLNEQSWTLEKFTVPGSNRRQLLVGSNSGLYQVVKDSAYLVQPLNIVFDIEQSNSDSTRIFLGTRSGVTALTYDLEERYWNENQEVFYGIDQRIRNLAEDNHGNLWLANNSEGVLRIRTEVDWLASNLDEFADAQGLPTGHQYHIQLINGKAYFGSKEGVFMYNESSDSILETAFSSPFSYMVSEFRFDGEDDIWIVDDFSNMGQDIFKISLADIIVDNDPFIRLPDMTIYSIFPEPNGVTWVGGTEGLYRHDEGIEKTYGDQLNVFIRKVHAGDVDTVIFHGQSTYANLDRGQTVGRNSLPFRLNHIVFEFATPSFNSESENRYQFKLEGKDKNWSGWTSNTRKEYDNLSEGTYSFMVKARNVFGEESEVVRYNFEIKPPWYRTIYAYLSYVLLFVGIIILIIWYNGKRLIRRNIELEKQVKQRTKEVTRQNQLLEEQKKEISAKAEDLRHANESILDKSAEIEAQRDKLASNYEQLEAAMSELQHQKELVEQKTVKLEEAQAELKSVNSNLEELVAKRTQELNDAYHQLLEKNKELDMFVYRSAHDLKGPIARFLGLCYVGKMEVKEDTAIDYLQRLEGTANEMNTMLSRLIRAHDINQKEVDIYQVRLKETIEAALKTHHHKEDCSMMVDTKGLSSQVVVETDAPLFNILIENLIQNAFKYQDIEKDQSFISIRSEYLQEQELVKIHVIDNGIGVSTDAEDKLFNMFFIGTERKGGFGLGLYEAKLVADKLGGKIEYSQTKEGNTCFTVTLPKRLEIREPEIIRN